MLFSKRFLLILSISILTICSCTNNNNTDPPPRPNNTSGTIAPNESENGHSRVSPPPSATDRLKKGVNKKKYNDGQVYFLYVPQALNENPSMKTDALAIIHGYTGQTNGKVGEQIAFENMERWIPYADKYNCILIGPHFSEKVFDSDYQRMNLRGTRADLRMIDIVESLKGYFPNLNTKKINFFGFSGGGQYVHRFCAFHPDRVGKAIASGGGWYLWPDASIRYPLGTDMKKYDYVAEINLNKLAQVPIQVLIGEQDIRQGSFRETYKDFDLNKLQGPDRISRAKKWVQAMRKHAIKQGVPCNITLETVANTEHNTSNDLIDKAVEYLFPLN